MVIYRFLWSSIETYEHLIDRHRMTVVSKSNRNETIVRSFTLDQRAVKEKSLIFIFSLFEKRHIRCDENNIVLVSSCFERRNDGFLFLQTSEMNVHVNELVRFSLRNRWTLWRSIEFFSKKSSMKENVFQLRIVLFSSAQCRKEKARLKKSFWRLFSSLWRKRVWILERQ